MSYQDIQVEVYQEDGITKIRTEEVIYFSILGRIYTIEKGFVSDGMSTPRFCWGIISPAVDARTLKYAICHDFMYQQGRELGISREEADKFLYQRLKDSGFGTFKSWLVYKSVQLFGNQYYK